jgi:hypothetical protein
MRELSDESPKQQREGNPKMFAPLSLPESPPQRHLVVRILGWIAVFFGALVAASGAAQIVMGMIYAPPVVGLILGLIAAIGGLSMAMPRRNKKE